MSSSSTSDLPIGSASPPVKRLLIDTDVHEYLRSKDDLLPYLPEYWQRYLRVHYPNKSPALPSAFPYGVMVDTPGRADWMNADGSIGNSLVDLQRHLFEGEGVSHAILNGFLYPSTMVGNYEFANALASAYNDWQIAEWLEPDPRILGSIQVVAHDPVAAAREIDRVADHPQIVQVFLPLVVERQYGDPFYHPIFEAAIRNDLAVALHHSGATKTLFGYPRYWIEWHMFAAPHSAMNQAMSMICNGLFDQYPELSVVFLETGVSWLPWFMWRADAQYRELRVEIPWVKRLPSEHMRDCVRLATQPLGDIKPANLLRIIEDSDSDRMLMFATDYPHFDADSAEVVLTKTIPDDIQARIRHQNALDTYRRLPGLVDAT